VSPPIAVQTKLRWLAVLGCIQTPPACRICMRVRAGALRPLPCLLGRLLWAHDYPPLTPHTHQPLRVKGVKPAPVDAPPRPLKLERLYYTVL
jgi:hypothetical protein